MMPHRKRSSLLLNPPDCLGCTVVGKLPVLRTTTVANAEVNLIDYLFILNSKHENFKFN